TRRSSDLLAVCRVHALLPDAGSVGVTAIDKRPVEGRVTVRPLGLYADLQANRADHGGHDQAVYAYAQEDADHWAPELGREVVPGLFGENLRRRGVDVNDTVIGELWRVGTALLEVTQPRTPCQTFARRLRGDLWVRRFTLAHRTGAYLRVVENGELGTGDTVDVVARRTHGVTIADWFGASHDVRGAGEPVALESIARRLLDAQAAGELRLSTEMHQRAERALTRATTQAP